jgi:hypothetical protein
MDQLLPGPSGAGGLAGYLHAHARTATKSVTVEAKGSMTADVSKELADNPYYITRPVATTVRAAGKKQEEAPALAPAHKKVPVSAGDVCSPVLTNEDLCRAYAHVIPLLQVRGVCRQCGYRGSIYPPFSQVYLVLTTSSAECERGVSVLGLILTAPRNRITQATLEQEYTTTQSNTDTQKHALAPTHTLLLPQLMMIKINGRVLLEHDFDASAKTFFSPHLLLLAHTTPSTSPPKDLKPHTLI